MNFRTEFCQFFSLFLHPACSCCTYNLLVGVLSASTAAFHRVAFTRKSGLASEVRLPLLVSHFCFSWVKQLLFPPSWSYSFEIIILYIVNSEVNSGSNYLLYMYIVIHKVCMIEKKQQHAHERGKL